MLALFYLTCLGVLVQSSKPHTLIVGFGRAEVAPLHKALSKTFSLLGCFSPEIHSYPRALTP